MSLFIPVLLNTMANEAATGGDVIEDCIPRTCKEGMCEAPVGKDTCRACVVGVGTMLWTESTQTLDEFTSATVSFLGKDMPSISFALYVISFGVIFSALVMITCGAWADYFDYRRRGLIGATAVACILTCLFVVMGDPSLYVVGGWLAIVANAAFSLCIVYYNAFLPVLVEDHPEVQGASPARVEVVRDEIQTYMSTFGSVFGYVGQLLNLIVAIGIALALSSAENNLGQRIAIFCAGIWYAVLSLWTFKFLKPHPGKELPQGDSLWHKGWSSTASTLSKMKAFPETVKFFVAYFFYSDTYSTVASVGILIINDLLCANLMVLILIFLEVMVFAIVGNIASLYLQKRFQLQAKLMILACLAVYMLISAWGMVGLIPNSAFGLKRIWEAFVFGAIHGLAIGPIQAYTRSMFSDLLIPGREAECFALYEISDKGSSWLGPMVVAEIINLTGKHHWGFLYLAIMTLLPALLLLSVDHQKGKEDVGNIGHQDVQTLAKEGSLSSASELAAKLARKGSFASSSHIPTPVASPQLHMHMSDSMRPSGQPVRLENGPNGVYFGHIPGQTV